MKRFSFIAGWVLAFSFCTASPVVFGGWEETLIRDNVIDCDLKQIQLDSLDRAHVVYIEYSLGILHYLGQTVDGWTFETIAAAEGHNFDLAVDWEKTPWVVFWNGSSVVCAHRKDGPWDVKSIQNVENNSPVAMDIDSQNRPVVFFYDAPNLVQGVLSNGFWECTNELELTSVGYFDMALDRQDQPHITIRVNDSFCYYTRKNGEWSYQLLESDGDSCWCTSGYSSRIAVARSGKPHIIASTYIECWEYTGGIPPYRPTFMGYDSCYYSQDNGGNFFSNGFGSEWYHGNGRIALDLFEFPMITSLDNRFYHQSESDDWSSIPLESTDAEKDLTVNSSGEPMIIYLKEKSLYCISEHSDLTYRLLMPDCYLEAGDEFNVSRRVKNNTESPMEVCEWIAFQAGGSFWFFPDWTDTPVSLQKILPAGEDTTEDILRFAWPNGVPVMSYLEFWGALTSPEDQHLISLAHMEFQVAGE